MAVNVNETEIEYDAPAGAALPCLDYLPGVAGTTGPDEKRLEAEYYDTDSFRLGHGARGSAHPARLSALDALGPGAAKSMTAVAQVNGEDMRDWRGIKAGIGDRVFYVMADGTHEPEIHEAWVEEADESHILVRSTASASGEPCGNGRETRRLKQPEDFVVVKGQGFI